MMWSPQQEQALQSVAAWFQSGNEQVHRCFGFAGTGKTTLARHFADQIKGSTEYAAFTGKAAMVMRNSGCDGAGTIHSKIYKVKRNLQTGKLQFNLDKSEGNAIKQAALVVIDECSMVDEDLGKDLVSYGKPILVLGDPAQLPPVKGGGYFTNAEPDVMLTEIHRQAEGDPIIHLATTIRTGGTLEYGQYGESAVITKRDVNAKMILDADQVLVGKNETRHAYNRRIRELKGHTHWLPVEGERLVCLKNNKESGLYNGSLVDVVAVHPRSSNDVADKLIPITVRSADEPDADVIKTVVREECFTGGLDDIHWSELTGTDQFNFGYALTTHKAQGSQWPSVIVFDESRTFRQDAQRWLYTACTRASQKITIIR